ncbi:amidohydrolase family protein [Flexibacterium corallicola]|uniref:amidohydrolase family protein n=1 Tax=Flexibacterium corallicola TaxID=3037259 RepID=UPI00286F093B|nr:amidohydrolase family protein [Pseudovibrio sp. M1P-2-3]
MRLDAHQHFWKVSRGDYYWMTPEYASLKRDFLPDDLQCHLKACQMDGTIVVQAANTTEETQFILGLSEEHEWIKGVVGWVPLHDASSMEALKTFSKHPKFVGVRAMLHDLEPTDWINTHALQGAIDTIIDLELSLDVLVRPEHLKPVHGFLTRNPDLRCVIDHMAKPDLDTGRVLHWDHDLGQLATETGAYIKLSGLATQTQHAWTARKFEPYIEDVLALFGAGRCMFGSDWPVLTVNGSYESWVRALDNITGELSLKDKKGIWGESAAHFYRIQT